MAIVNAFIDLPKNCFKVYKVFFNDSVELFKLFSIVFAPTIFRKAFYVCIKCKTYGKIYLALGKVSLKANFG